MTIQSITAHFDCDECGKPFEVDVDPAIKPPVDGAVLEAVEGYMLTNVSGEHFCNFICFNENKKDNG